MSIDKNFVGQSYVLYVLAILSGYVTIVLITKAMFGLASLKQQTLLQQVWKLSFQSCLV